MINREEIIYNMCKTFRHDFGLTISETAKVHPLMSGMTEQEKESLYNSMAQIFDNDIAPYMDFKERYKFTGDHFTFQTTKWKEYQKYLNERFGNDLDCVEVGTYEGMSALYILDNFVGETGHLYTIDPLIMPGSKETCLNNLNSHEKRNQVTQINGFSITELPKLLETHQEKIHFIYVDAGKTAMDNLFSLVVAERLLAVGGLIIVDDYEWAKANNVDPKKSPAPAVDWFMNNSLLCEPYDIGYQAAFVKRSPNDLMLIYNR